MTETQHETYQRYLKKAWIIYGLLTLALIILLVLFVASDNEERFFFTIMPAAAAYVLRPTEKYMSGLILKYTGVSKPEDDE